MASYLVEAYSFRARTRTTRVAGGALVLRTEAVAGGLRPLHPYVLLAGDETCFHVFGAASHDTVVEACWLAGLETPRIVPAVE